MTLQEFFQENRAVALAFSGGVDSAYLLYAGVAAGCDICAYYVKSEFQPQFELEDARLLSERLGAKMKILRLSPLDDEKVRLNGPRRCYYCKLQIFSAIQREVEKDGYPVLIDGTNASDDVEDRPGMQALKELSVRSPLQECGITKAEVRRLSREAGLFTWNKPSYACLATRIPTGTEIREEDLRITETAEGILTGMGFSDFRIRKNGTVGRIQLREEQVPDLFRRRKEILEKLRPFYETIVLDLEVRS